MILAAILTVMSVTTYGEDGPSAPVGAEAVDLGLPSGTKWANMNVGAEKPEDYGLYFAWGETTGYTSDTSDGHLFSWETYQYVSSSYDVVDIGSDIAGTEYDAATAHWGTPWRMPSKTQIKELQENCSSEWTTQNGVNGRKFTSNKNGNSIFLPAAGSRWDCELVNAGSVGYYWSSTPFDEDLACELYIDSGYVSRYNRIRTDGRSVRPVRKN